MFLMSSLVDHSKGESTYRDSACGPEPDATAGIESLLKEFDADIDFRNMSYMPQKSELKESRFDYLLRDIGGATSKARRDRVRADDYSEPPLLDGLAVNLLKQAADRHISSIFTPNGVRRSLRGVFGSRPGEELSFGTFLSEISDPARWRESAIGRGDGLEFCYFFKLGIRYQELTFRAQEDPSGSLTLSSVKRVPDSKFELRLFRSDFNEIILDQRRRHILGKRFEDAPRVAGLPPKLRATIKAKLEAVGIPNGSYSRLGFSSGRFPFPRVRSMVSLHARSETSSGNRELYLVFNRCPSCGLVNDFAIEGSPTMSQEKAAEWIRDHAIHPWHRENCAEHSVSYARKLSANFYKNDLR